MIYHSNYSKYKNSKIVDKVYGKFDSRKEYMRFLVLLEKQKNGEIRQLERQKAYMLIPSQKLANGKTERACKYIADFVYVQGGKTIVEDAKGFRTDVYKIKKKLMLSIYGIEIQEV